MKWKESQYVAPARTDLYQAGVLLEEIGAVEIAAPVEEDFQGSVRAVDQISAELVGGEQACAGGDVRVGGDGKLVGGECAGGSEIERCQQDEGGEREAAEAGVECAKVVGVFEE